MTHNLMQHAGGGIQIACSDNNYPSQPSARILIQNNVYNDISVANWGGRGWANEFVMDSNLTNPHDVVIDHNTIFEDQMFVALGDTGMMNNLQLTNNIADYGEYGIFGGTQGTSALATFVSGLSYDRNVFTTTSRGTYPTGTLWANSLAGVGFTKYSGTDPNLSGNFQLTTKSPYQNAGTDGKDIGVWDWTCLNNDVAAALAGTFVPGPGGCAVGEAVGTSAPIQPPANLNAVVY